MAEHTSQVPEEVNPDDQYEVPTETPTLQTKAAEQPINTSAILEDYQISSFSIEAALAGLRDSLPPLMTEEYVELLRLAHPPMPADQNPSTFEFITP